MTEYLNDQDVMLSAIDKPNNTRTHHTTDHATTTTHGDSVDVVKHKDVDDDDVDDVNVSNESDKELINKESKDDDNDSGFVEGDYLVLTTIDNPHNPKTDYALWKRWDNENGYNTEEYIARLINMESDYDVEDEFTLNIITNRVIDDILLNDTLELYALV